MSEVMLQSNRYFLQSNRYFFPYNQRSALPYARCSTRLIVCVGQLTACAAAAGSGGTTNLDA